MFCEVCGAKLDDDSLFCPECGARVAIPEMQAPGRAAVFQEENSSPEEALTGKAPEEISRAAVNPEESAYSAGPDAGQAEQPEPSPVSADTAAVQRLHIPVSLEQVSVHHQIRKQRRDLRRGNGKSVEEREHRIEAAA